MTFMNMLNQIKLMASTMSKYWNDKFSADELVNEAWISSLRHNFTDAPLIMRRAKLDMMDYIRRQVGREYFYNKNGKVARKTPVPKHFTNQDGGCDKYGDEPSGHHRNNSIFDGRYMDNNLLRLENNELLAKLILSEPTEQQLDAITLYYFNNKSLKEIGVMRGKSESRICAVIKDGIKRCTEKAVKMELVEI